LTVQIAIVGAGYVGLVTAACLAELGHVVTTIDHDQERIRVLRDGGVPIHEPGLAELIGSGITAGRLSFETQLSSARGCTFIIIAVGTLDAVGDWTGEYVRQAAVEVAQDAQAPRQVVVRSTLMPGTASALRTELRGISEAIELAHNPEFTREGSAVTDFLSPDRVVIGLEEPNLDSPLGDQLADVYRPVGAPIIRTDLVSAETIKIASNVFLANKIAYANELARFCASAGADVNAVVDAMGLDRRIGRQFLSPGPGFGGSCLPSQAATLPRHARALGLQLPVIEAVSRSNGLHAEWLVDQLKRELGGSLDGRRIGVLGLTFKAGTDDLRESPGLRMARLIGGSGGQLNVYDPAATAAAAAALAIDGIAVDQATEAIGACAGADAVIVTTEWPQFRELDWPAAAALMRGRLVFDARTIVDVPAATGAGLDVIVLGRRHRRQQPVAARRVSGRRQGPPPMTRS
jgi:UDPglucose 6-dehydrogenase